MMRGAVHHVDLSVRDLAASRVFHGAGHYAVFFSDPDGLKLEYVHKPD